jgi:hypothetical protein
MHTLFFYESIFEVLHMVKKIVASLTCMALLFTISVSGFAQGLIKITKPEGSEESTFKKSYVISGKTDKEDVVVELSRYRADLGYFTPLSNSEGETSWIIGSSGMFMKEVPLNEGANKLKIVAYRNSDPENKQTEQFTITLLREDLKDKIMNGVLKFNDVFKNVKNVFGE